MSSFSSPCCEGIPRFDCGESSLASLLKIARSSQGLTTRQAVQANDRCVEKSGSESHLTSDRYSQRKMKLAVKPAGDRRGNAGRQNGLIAPLKFHSEPYLLTMDRSVAC